MTTPPSPDAPMRPAEREQVARSLVDEFLRNRHTDATPDPFALILAHPHLAGELERLLDAEIQDYLALQSSPRAECQPALAPATIGRYRIDGRLGAGSSAVVYRAYDPKFQRSVALKVVRGDPTADSSAVGRFERDARTLARLRHPHIVPLHETGESDGLRWIDMELVPGETLEARLGRPPRPEFRWAAELVQRVAEALHYAHQAGVVHRDVKPSNILLDAAGAPQLADFGLARRIGTDESLTLPGQLLGTPAYMSPEQARLQPHEADARSDVYSLGVVLYRLLAGRLPFEAGDSPHSLLRKIEAEEPPPPRRHRPDVPADLETICLKAMEKRPENRFATAGAFGEELWRWLHDEPLTIRRPGLWERTRRWARRKQLLTRSSLTAAALLIACLTLGWTAWNQYKSAELARGQHSLELEKSRTRAAELARRQHSLELETELRARTQIRSLLEGVWQRLRSPAAGRRVEAQELLRILAKPRRSIVNAKELEAIDLEARSLFALTLALPDLVTDDAVKLPAAAFHTWPVAFRPDGRAVAIGTTDKPIVWFLGQKPPIPETLDNLGSPPRIAFSPDGQYLTVAPATGGLQVWDGNGGSRQNTPVEPTKGKVLAVAWDDNSTTLRAFHVDGRTRVWSLPDFQERSQCPIDGTKAGDWTAARFAPNGTLAIGNGSGQVKLYDATGELSPAIADQTVRTEVQALAWSADSNLLAVGLKGGRIQLRRLDGSVVREFRRSMAVITSLDFSPMNQWLIAAGIGGGTSIWDLESGELLLTAAGACGAISKDGRSFASADSNDVRLHRVVYPTTVRVYRGHADSIAQITWSSDARRVATLDASFDVRVWDVELNSLIDQFAAPPGGFFAENAAIAVNHNGSLLAYASGGKHQSQAVIRDIAAKTTLNPWPLAGGYETLASTGPDRFLLVREELQSGIATVRTVAHVLRPNQLGKAEVIRPSETGDRRGFLTNHLTPDGRHYCWVGPREPWAAQRVEVWVLDPAKRITRVLTPQRNEVETGAALDPSGQYLWVHYGGGVRRYDIIAHDPPTQSMAVGYATKGVHAGVTFEIQDEKRDENTETPRHGSGAILVANSADGRRLRLTTYDDSPPGQLAFSPEGSRLAWGTRSGLLFVADLDALMREIGTFEAELRTSH